MKNLKIIMVDSLIGNDYSTCLCRELNQAGATVTMIVPENKVFYRNEKFDILFLSPAKDKSQNKIIKLFGFIRYIFILRHMIINLRYDLVHYQFFRKKIEILFFRYLKFRGIKLIVTAHNILPHESKRIDHFWNSILYKNADSIIVHSSNIKNKMIRLFDINEKKIQIIPHGNFDNYLPEKDLSFEQARATFALTPSDNVLLFFGFIRPYKGLHLLLEAFEQSAAKDPNLKLLIAGSSEGFQIRNNITTAIENNKFRNRIIYNLNFIKNEDIPKYFKAADLVVLPYKDIDHSGIIHLAYSFGKAVLATNVGDFEEVIINDKSGKILKENSYEELSDTIINMFEDKNKIYKMGKYAKLLSETKYSWTEISEKTIQLYNSVLGFANTKPDISEAKKHKTCSICIATYKRPELLKLLLDSLIIQELTTEIKVEIIVVDNDPEESGKPVIKKYTNSSNITFFYFVQGVKNISETRNKAVKNSTGEYIFFIDDDEVASPNWVRLMLETLESYNADAVFGRIESKFNDEVPDWIKKSYIFNRPSPPTGTLTLAPRTGNCLIRASIIKQIDGPFDANFGLTGGEDTHLFGRLQKNGSIFINCHDAWVTELQPSSRSNTSYLIKRAFFTGNLATRRFIEFSKKPKLLNRIYYLLKSIVLLIISFIFMIICLPNHHYRIFWATKIASNIGHFLGVFNIKIYAYR